MTREEAMRLIPPIASKLARKMIEIQHSPESKGMIATAYYYLEEIHDLTFLKGNKRLSDDDLWQSMWDEPMGEYDDYLRKHSAVSRRKSKTNFTPPSQEDYDAIKKKYTKAMYLIRTSKTHAPKYEDLE